MSRRALVLQMQRMGDLVLSFPLFLWLKRQEPDRPVIVVAEEQFYEGLKALSPQVVYAPWTAADRLPEGEYAPVLNLSHRPEAADLAGRIPVGSSEGGTPLGPYRDAGGALRVGGAWQLYRASVTHNNRHNRYHWAELNALDCVEPTLLRSTRFDPPRTPAPGKNTVGLFLGASQEEKRPGAPFWAALAHALQKRGVKPVLLGGPGDVPLAAQVRALHGGTLGDFTGKLGLHQFMAAGQTLSLMVTPDTGPMHVAAWAGLMTLNLSMGPVNPWETGPFSPGHYVLRAGLSCLGCWHCRFPEPLCREKFDPEQVAYLAWKLCKGGKPKPPPGMRLFRTGRTPEGLYNLERLGQAETSAAHLLGAFWQTAFGAYFGLLDPAHCAAAWARLEDAHPALARAFLRGAARLAAGVGGALANGQPLASSFFLGFPPMLRPAAGYVQMALENADYAPPALAEALRLLELLQTART